MKPYYQDEWVSIYHGDCREILAELPVAEAIITDPPYGIAYEAMRGAHAAIAGDGSPEGARMLLRATLTLTRAAAVHYVCCDWRSVGMVVEEMTRLAISPKSCIVWDKGHGVQNLDRFAKSYELIVYAGPFGGEPTVATDIWRVSRDCAPSHPTPKPVSLMARCISYATSPGALVIDPFMGSGSTLRAAKDLGRHAIGVELEERYCEVAAKRMSQETLGLSA